MQGPSPTTPSHPHPSRGSPALFAAIDLMEDCLQHKESQLVAEIWAYTRRAEAIEEDEILFSKESLGPGLRTTLEVLDYGQNLELTRPVQTMAEAVAWFTMCLLTSGDLICLTATLARTPVMNRNAGLLEALPSVSIIWQSPLQQRLLYGFTMVEEEYRLSLVDLANGEPLPRRVVEDLMLIVDVSTALK